MRHRQATRAVKLEAQEDRSQKGDDWLGLHRARTRSARMMMLRKGHYCPRSVPPGVKRRCPHSDVRGSIGRVQGGVGK